MLKDFQEKKYTHMIFSFFLFFIKPDRLYILNLYCALLLHLVTVRAVDIIFALIFETEKQENWRFFLHWAAESNESWK